jgi:integrase
MSRTQSGYVYSDKKASAWFLRFYTGEAIIRADGKKIYPSKTIRLGSTSSKSPDYISTLTKARTLAAELLPKELKKATQTKVTVAEYYETEIEPLWKRQVADGNLKPSTVYGFQQLFRLYVKPRIGNQKIVDMTTGGAVRFLDSLALARLNTNTISHTRHVASRIFDHAAAREVIPANPFRGAKMLESARKPKETAHYNVQQIAQILTTLRGHLQAQTAVALCYFCGLRPGEARATKWENYDGLRLKIDSSAWRREVTSPKTVQSAQTVPVKYPLTELLTQLRAESGNPTSGFILRGERTGRALNLDVLAKKVIRPALAGVGIDWLGFYACRRGCATAATENSSAQEAAAMLRHKGIGTTVAHYIKLEDSHRENAADAISKQYAGIQSQKLLAGESKRA